MANILILGGGFGGLVAAERLSAALGDRHQITLISPRRNFTFYPALVRLAFDECRTDEIAFDLAERLAELKVHLIEGEAIEIKANQRRVRVTGKDYHGEIAYDYLIIATGRRLATEKVRGFYEYAHHLLDVKAALRFGEAVRAFESGKILVGMSPQAFLPVPVCETAFALARRFRPAIEKGEIAIDLVFPETIAAAFGGARIHEQLSEAFDKHKIGVTEHFPIKEISKYEVVAADARALSFDLLMLLPPFRGHAFTGSMGVSDEHGFLIVDERMRVPHFSGVYAVGDGVDFAGPKLAQMAVRQAETAAANLASEIEGREPDAFYYHEIATIIDEGGADSIYLHYGIWDDSLYRLKKGQVWHLVKALHDRYWQARHG